MRTVNIHEAKTKLSSLLVAVKNGEEIVIAKSGRPIARLIAIRVEERKLGVDDGKLFIADDFDSFIPPEFEPYC